MVGVITPRRGTCRWCGSQRLRRSLPGGICDPQSRHACTTLPTDDTAPTKICRACREAWPMTREFWNAHTQASDGLRPECRACRAERRRALRAGAARVRPWHGTCNDPRS